MSEGFFFQAFEAGKIPPPPCAKTLGIEIKSYDLAANTVELAFEGRPEFANPVGNVQGGFLTAMLDDAMGLAYATIMKMGEFAPTLALNVQFQRPAKIGKLEGTGRIINRGREVLHLGAELRQDGKVIATATATALIVQSRGVGADA